MRRTFVVECWSRAYVVDENNDAYTTRRNADGSVLYAAVADGASSTLFSREWADRLVTLLADAEPSSTSLSAMVDEARADFDPLVGRPGLDQRVTEKWLLNGSASTLVAVTARMRTSSIVSVEAKAVGDSVLIVLDRREVHVFPLLRSSEFGTTPSLIASHDAEATTFQSFSTDATSDAVFVLATDGAAKFVLRMMEREGVHMVRESLADLCVNTEPEALDRALARPGDAVFDDDATLVLFTAATSVGSSGEALRRQLLAETGRPTTAYRATLLAGLWDRFGELFRRLLKRWRTLTRRG